MRERPPRKPRRKARTFLQHTFIQWFEDRKHAFAVPAHLGRRTDRTLRIILEGAPSALDIVLMHDGPQVFVNLNGDVFDWILWGEISPKKFPMGTSARSTSRTRATCIPLARRSGASTASRISSPGSTPSTRSRPGWPATEARRKDGGGHD